MENSNDTNGNRTHDLSACSAVPQPTAPSRTSIGASTSTKQDFIPHHIITHLFIYAN